MHQYSDGNMLLHDQSGEGLNECEQTLSAQGAVTTLCVDRVNGAIVAGVQQYIR